MVAAGELGTLQIKDQVVGTADALLPLRHTLGRRVLWRIIDWQATTAGSAPNLQRDATTSKDILVLASYTAGTVSIEIEGIDG